MLKDAKLDMALTGDWVKSLEKLGVRVVYLDQAIPETGKAIKYEHLKAKYKDVLLNLMSHAVNSADSSTPIVSLTSFALEYGQEIAIFSVTTANQVLVKGTVEVSELAMGVSGLDKCNYLVVKYAL